MSDEDVSPASRPLPELIGGRYRIVSRLGIGGMGVVYKANDIQLNRAVAIKALEDRRVLMAGASSRLRTEALAAASLDHPYICKVYELVETPTETFIVMEYVAGETLSSIVKRGPLPLLQTLQVAREIAEGLANAHAHGLVHRDVKPANVMVTPSGHVKLLDFGVAGADVESTAGDQTRTVLPQFTAHAATPQYMAPEQAAGQSVTTRADLFSLGVVMYECLTGALPFSGSSTFDYVRNMMQSAPRRLDRIAPDTPADLVDLIERCLEKAPVDRPESADAIVTELRRLSSALTSPEVSVRSARQARSGRTWKIVAAGALVAAAIAGGWRFVSSRTSNDTPLRQSRAFVTSAAQEFESRVSPDGEWVSFISTSGGGSQVMVQRVDGGDARPLTLGTGTPVSQVWSPDGKQLACVLSVNGALVLQVYPAFFGGAPQQTAALDAALMMNRATLLRWIDRTIYVQVNDREGQYLGRLDLDNPAPVTNLSAGWKLPSPLRGVDVRPDGAAVVFTMTTNGQEDLWTANIDGSSPRALTNDAFFDRSPLWTGDGDAIIFQSNRGGQFDLWQIDPRTGTLTAVLSSEKETVAESTSADGSVISFQRLYHEAQLWMWRTADGTGQQLTQDALSDYSPVISGNGTVVAFQRSQPTPSRGYTIMDARIFVAPFGAQPVVDARAVVDGYAAELSNDGTWLAYLQTGERPARMKLHVRNIASGATTTLSIEAGPPSLSMYPVDWSSRIMTFGRTGGDLFFVDHPDVALIRRYRSGETKADAPLTRGTSPTDFIRDLYVSPDDRRLAYVSSPKETTTVHVLTIETGADKTWLTLPRTPGVSGIYGRGWLDDGFVIVRNVAVREEGGHDMEVLVVDASGTPKRAGLITHAFAGTTRLHAARRVMYVTRVESGVHNLYEFSFATGTTRALTRNALAGVTFSGFHPVGRDAVIGAREERRQDIWLSQVTATPRPGNPAGR